MTRAEAAAAEAAMAAPQICGKYNEGKKKNFFSLLRLSFHHRSIRVVSPSFCIFFPAPAGDRCEGVLLQERKNAKIYYFRCFSASVRRRRRL